MAVSALDLYLTGSRYTEAVKILAPLSKRGDLPALTLASCALEVYLKASLAASGQPPDYPSRVPFYRQDLAKLYRDAQTAGLAKVEGTDELIENANSFHQFFHYIAGRPVRYVDGGPDEALGSGDVLLISYLDIDIIAPPPPSPDVLERLDKAVEAHVRALPAK